MAVRRPRPWIRARHWLRSQQAAALGDELAEAAGFFIVWAASLGLLVLLYAVRR